MKRIFPLLLILGLGLQSTLEAQKSRRKSQSEETPVSSSPIFDEMIFDNPPIIRARDEENTYLISEDVTAGKTFLMYSAISNAEDRLVFNKELEIEKPKNLPYGVSNFYDILPLHNGQTAIIFKHIVKDSKFSKGSDHGVYLLYARMIDNTTGNVNPTPIYISEYNRKNYNNIYNVFLAHSPDRKHLIMHETVGVGKSGKSIFHILDQDLNEIDSFEDEGRLAKGELKKLMIDNEGSIYAISFYEGKPVVTSYDALLGYEKWEENIEFNFPTSEKMLYSCMASFISPSGQLILSGMMEEAMKGTYEPLFQFTAALNIETKETDYAELSTIDREEVIFPLVDPRDLARAQKKGKEVEFKGSFTESYFFNKPSGGFYYVAQEYIHVVTYDSYGRVLKEDVNFGNILVFNVNSDGKVIWTKPVRQSQSLNRKGYGALAGYCKEDNLTLLLNISEDNFNLPSDERLASMKGEKDMISIEMSFDKEDGNTDVQRLQLFRAHQNAPLAPSSYYERYFDNEIIFIGAAKRGGTRYVQLHRIDRSKL